MHQATSLDFPDVSSAKPLERHQSLAVGSELRVANCAFTLVVSTDFLAVFDIPQAACTIEGCRGEIAVVR